jgi:hypothetical protein
MVAAPAKAAVMMHLSPIDMATPPADLKIRRIGLMLLRLPDGRNKLILIQARVKNQFDIMDQLGM